jgi:hypothetical protein
VQYGEELFEGTKIVRGCAVVRGECERLLFEGCSRGVRGFSSSNCLRCLHARQAPRHHVLCEGVRVCEVVRRLFEEWPRGCARGIVQGVRIQQLAVLAQPALYITSPSRPNARLFEGVCENCASGHCMCRSLRIFGEIFI